MSESDLEKKEVSVGRFAEVARRLVRGSLARLGLHPRVPNVER